MGCPTLVPLIELKLPSVISNFSRYGPGLEIANLAETTSANTTWGTANLAQLFEITIPSEFTARSLRFRSGAAVVGNYDFGIYDQNFSLLRALGSKVHPGANIFVEEVISALSLQPGNYWLAFVADNGGFGIRTRNASDGSELQTAPIRAATGSFPLPTAIIPTATPTDRLPSLSMARETI